MSARPDLQTVQLGRDLISYWMGLMRALRLYERGNETLENVTGRILAAARELMAGEPGLEIRVRQDAIFLAGERLREGAVASSGYQGFVDLLRRSGVVRFELGEEATPEEVERFARLLAQVATGERRREELAPELSVQGITSIDVGLEDDREEGFQRFDNAEMARRVYLRSIGVIKSVFHHMRRDGRINARMVKRAVQQMIESVDHGYMLDLTSLKNYDEYTFNHSVNVSVLAIALGRAVGLSRRQQYIVGQAGMLHDLGKLCCAKTILNKAGRLTPEERRAIQSHPVDGFISVATRLGVSDETIPVALAAFQHHANLDGSGYPAAATQGPISFLSRIVAIVDRYDAMTSERVYRKEAIPPAKALAILYRHSAQLDPALFSSFLNLMGMFPLGTTVRLTDGSIAIVVEGNDDVQLRHLPKVRLVLDPEGCPAEGAVVDLSATAKDPEPITIAETVDPSAYGIELMDYLL